MAKKSSKEKFEALLGDIPAKGEKVNRSIYIDKGLWDDFKRQCDRAGVTTTDVITKLIEGFMER